MARVSSVIPNLFNGISQQASSLRLLTQGEEQVNMYPSLVQGLVKRPPLQYISALGPSLFDKKGTFHVVDRGGDAGGRERCFIYITETGIRAFRPDGTEKECRIHQQAEHYLKGSDGRFEVATIADHTFIINPNIRVEMSSNIKTPAADEKALVHIKQAAYNTSYQVTVYIYDASNPDNRTYLSSSYMTPSSQGTVNNPPPFISTQLIAQSLSNSLHENRLYVYHTGAVMVMEAQYPYKISHIKITDSQGDNLMSSVYKRVKRFSELPKEAPNGMVVQVTGDDSSKYNDYYVKFTTDEVYGGVSTGVWKECPAPSTPTPLNVFTMPHVLIDHGTHFEFSLCKQWGHRTVGDENTAPDPEFVGQCLSGVFQYRNRLGLLSGDIVALSEASEFFNFFPKTVTTLVDSNPIFLSASTAGAPTLKYALPFNEEIILFSDRAQFKLSSPDVLSPSTAAVNTVTSYPVNTEIKPITNGRNLFFATRSITAPFTHVNEYYIDSDTGGKAAYDITAHTPQYIPAQANRMVCSTSMDLICLFSANKASSDLWFYKYYWSGNEKLQAAWFKFSFNSHLVIKDAAFLDEVLYLIIENTFNTEVYLCKMDFSATLTAATEQAVDPLNAHSKAKFLPHLDMLQNNLSLSPLYYHADTDTTALAIPRYLDTEKAVLIDKDTLRELRPISRNERNCVFRGDIRSKRVFMGETYPAVYTFSTPYVRGSSGGDRGGLIASHAGRLQLQRWYLALGPTGYLEVHVIHSNGQKFVYPWPGSTLGQKVGILGRVNVQETARFQFPVRAKASDVSISVINNTWQPSCVISAEWEANYITRGLQRI